MDSDGFAQGMCQMYRCSVVNIALMACVQLHEKFSGAEDHNPGWVTAVQFSPASPPAPLPERSILEKNDGQQNIWRAKVNGAAIIPSTP